MNTETNTLEGLLGPKLITSKGDEIETAVLANKKLVILYFSAHWCGPCRRFTPRLSEAYEEYRKSGDMRTEVVFISRDKDAASFAEYHREMTFPAIPYSEADRREKLAAKFGVRGIPSLIVVSPSGDTIHDSVDVRTLISEHGAAALMPERLREEGDLQSFFDACMNGDVAVVRSRLETYTGIANRECPQEWHYRYIRRGGWQPVGGNNPGVKNATGEMYLISNFPAYGLQLAAGNGHTEIVRILLEAKADLEAEDGDGDTALAWATWCGRREVMDQLIDAGADASFANGISREQYEEIQGDGTSLEWIKQKIKSS